MFLSKISPQQLHVRLRQLAHLRSTRAADVDALLAALERLGITITPSRAALEDNTLLHCVQCHKQYLERDNGVESCKVKHNWDEGERWGTGCRYRCESCGEYAEEISPGFGFDHETMCFTGTHTTDVDVVDYEGTSTDTCDDNGCQVASSDAPSVEAEGKDHTLWQILIRTQCLPQSSQCDSMTSPR